MKKEVTKKKKLWLWIVIGLVAVLGAAAAIGIPMLMGEGTASTEPTETTGSQAEPARAELYWNLDREYYTENSETGMSTRQPGEDGMYTMRFAYEGEVKEYKVADKHLVNFMDNLDCVQLFFAEDGTISDAVDVRDVATEVGKELYVRYVRNDTIYANTSLAMNGMTLMLDISELTRIYDVSLDSETLGQIIQPEQLQPMDCLTIYANSKEQNTHVFLREKPEKSNVYWRVQGHYDTSTQGTSRVPDASGAYSIDFFCDGEIVTLKCKDKKIVDNIDYKSDYKAHFGFIFDEEGYIVKRISSELGIQARGIGEGYDVTYIEDDEIEITSTIWSNAGEVENFKLEDDTVIYDVSKAALAEGRQGQRVDSLQMGDRVMVWLDTENDAVMVYVTERLVDSPVYYNVERKYSSSLKESTRTPNADGWYEVKLAVEGQVKTFKTKDKAKIDYLDSLYPKAMGLKVVNGNEIEYVYHPNCIFGQKYYCDGRWVTKIAGSILELWSRGQDTTYNCILGADIKVYDISGVGEMGSETTLKVGDNVLAYRNVNGELVCFFVLCRSYPGSDLYWNLSRKYDATTEETTREPDAEGWYVFTMAQGGKTVTVKTQSKAMATKIDSFSPGAVGMVVNSSGVVQMAFHPMNVNGGGSLTSGTYVSAIRNDGTIQTYSLKTGKYLDIPLAENCKIYNISSIYSKEKGELTTLKMGDMITVYPNMKKEAAVVYVRSRETDYMYWKLDRFYDSTTGTTTRVPDAEGWYVFDVAVDGKVKTVKTKDKTIASTVDSYEKGFTLILSGDEIIRCASGTYVKDVSGDGAVNWDVVSVNGNKVTVKYNRDGSENTGKTMTITLAKNVKIMDVSPNAEKFGAYVTLQPGDRIRGYVNSNDEHLYIWIKNRGMREKGMESYCGHCGKVVTWDPYHGSSLPKTGGHYYLASDITVSSQTNVGSEDLDYEVVLDLNGKTLTRNNGRAVLVYRGDKLTILDSVGGGEIRSTGSEAGNGGVVLVSGGGELTILSGTLRKIQGETDPKYGGCIYVSGATLNIKNGTVAEGKATYGGNIGISGGILNMTGGALTNGTASLYGGNIYATDKAVLNISDGKICGGTAGDYAANIYLTTSGEVTLNLTGGEIAGDIRINGAAAVNVSGTVKVGVGSEGGLDMRNGTVLNLGDLKTGANIAISRTGAFSAYYENAADYEGFFRTAKEGGTIYTQNGVLCAASGAVRFADCEHCGETVLWTQWENTNAPAAGHYFLTGGVNMERTRVNIGSSDNRETEIVLDLCGNTWTTGDNRAFWVYGKFFVMDTVGGGEIVANGSNMGSGGVMRVDGSLTIYSGTIRRNVSESIVGRGGVLQLTSGSQFVMLGGKLTDGVCVTYTDTSDKVIDARGGILYAEKATIRIEGGSLEAGTAELGAGMYLVNCNTQLTDATVSDAVEVTGGGSFTVSGSTKLADLQISDVKLTLGELQEGAAIAVTANGAVTEANENAKTYLEKGWIFSLPVQQTLWEEEGILYAELIPEGAVKRECVHCGGQVWWLPWESTNAPASGHYFLTDHVNTDRTRTNIGTSSNKNADVVLDLSGFTWTTGDNRAFWVYGDFAVMDSVGGGEIVANGSDMGSGGVIRVDGSLTLYSGTIRRNVSESLVGKGGILYLSSGSQFTMKGGKLTGGVCVQYTDSANKVVSALGGSIYADGATITLEDGIIENGTAASGGNLYLEDSTFLMSGGTITGGTVTGNGGNIFMVTSTMELSGGTVEKGIAGNRGGNILTDEKCNFIMSGGMIRDGQAAKQGGNFRVNYSSTEITISGGTIMGDMTVYSVKKFTLSGSPKILMGNSAGLILGDGIDPSAGNTSLKLTLADLNADAEIYISAVGEITDAPAAEYLSCFKGALRTVISADETTGVLMATQGNTGYCPHCWETGVPATWTDASLIGSAASGAYTKLGEDAHYYLTDNVTRSGNGSRLNIGGTSSPDVDIVIDLNGYNWTTTNNRVAQVFAHLTVMDSLCKGVMKGSTIGADPYSSVVTVNLGTASLTLYSGTLQGDAVAAPAINCNKGVFNLCGGYVVGKQTEGETVKLGTAGSMNWTAGLLDGKVKEEEENQ